MDKYNKYLKKLYMTVKRNIDEMDCYHLLRDGAPPDEYDLETKDICKKITPENTAVEIAQIISGVFKYWMDVEYSIDKLMDIAKEIEQLRILMKEE